MLTTVLLCLVAIAGTCIQGQGTLPATLKDAFGNRPNYKHILDWFTENLPEDDVLGKTEGQITLFFPNKDYMSDETNVRPTGENVQQMTYYHVADGKLMAADIANDLFVPTLAMMPAHATTDDVNAQADTPIRLRLNVYPSDLNDETQQFVAAMGQRIVQANAVEAENGVLHVVESFVAITPPDLPTADILTTMGAVQDDEATDFTFDTLVYAFAKPDLLLVAAEILAAEHVTVLAPVDSELFNEAVIDSLLHDPETLRGILRDHVVKSTYFPVSALDGMQYDTLDNKKMKLKITPGTGADDPDVMSLQDLYDNDLATIIAGPYVTTQGVVYVIDRPIYII